MPEVLTQVDPDDSIEKPSGRELDAEIHVRIMGYPSECRLVGDGKSLETALHLEPDNAAWRVRSEADAYWHRLSPNGSDRVVIAPYYSSSIEAAMEVVEKFIAKGGRVSLRGGISQLMAEDVPPGYWQVHFYRQRLDITRSNLPCRPSGFRG